MAYSLGEYNDMIRILGENQNNEGLAARAYRQTYRGRRVRLPDRNVFVNLRDRMRNDGVLLPARRINAGRPRVINEDRILRHIENNPTTSTRQAGLHLGLSHSKIFETLKEDGQHPYHFTKVQNLNARDLGRRVRFSTWYDDRYDEAPDDFYRSIIWTDESTFNQNPVLNLHNRHTWSHENPRQVVEKSFQNRFSVNVWAAIINESVHIRFIDEARLTSEIYLDILRDDLPPLIAQQPEEIRENVWYQQDGAGPHSARVVTEYLNETFDDHWIGLHGPVEFPPRSPDLTPLDFWLWGHLKTIVYQERVNNGDELRELITAAVDSLTPAMIRRASLDVVHRTRWCLENQGDHFEQCL